MFSDSTSEMEIGLKFILNLLLHQETHLVQSFSIPIVFSNYDWQLKHSVSWEPAFRLACYSLIKHFMFFWTRLVYLEILWVKQDNYFQDFLQCPKGLNIPFLVKEKPHTFTCRSKFSICYSSLGKLFESQKNAIWGSQNWLLTMFFYSAVYKLILQII